MDFYIKVCVVTNLKAGFQENKSNSSGS